jgi:hypothetical protein
MMKKIFTLLLCSIVLSMAISCSEDGIEDTGFGELTGTVVSSGDNTPLENVKITTNPASTTVFTDAEGKFKIEKIAAGEYSVQADIDDYETAFEAANVINGETASVVFELEPSDFNNKPPTAPTLISPEDNGVVDSTSVTFVWTASDPDGDDLTYSLEIRNDKNQDVELFESLTDTTYTFSPLILGAKYFWQVSADDDINEPVWSMTKTFTVTAAPTNRYLFVRNINGNNVIFSSDEEGNEFQLTSENTNSYRPRRNVAANRIAYLQTTGGQVDLYTMKLDGTDKTKVTSDVSPNGFNLNEINIAWPQHSNRIYFPRFDKLYRIRSNGQGLQEIYQTTDGSLISEMAVSESGNLIVLKTNDINGYNVSIFTIDFSGTILDTILSGAQGAASGLDLSVTNNKVIYSYDVDEFQSSDYRRLNSRIFLYDLTLDTATDISGDKEGGTNDLEPRFSPNEASVIYTNTSNDGISQKNVFTLSMDDSESRTLLFNDAFMPDWE